MYTEIAANKRKTILLLLGFLIFIAGLGAVLAWYYGQPIITLWVLVGASIYAFITYYSASKMAAALNGAHEIQKRDNPRLYRIVENLAITEGMPMPKVYIIEDKALNAFATGRDPNHSLVCATSGLLAALNDQELEGVMAHELSHIKNYDIRVSMIAFALVAAVAILADVILRVAWFGSRESDDSRASAIFLILGIVAAILAPIVATLIQLAISRKREYLADASGALATRYPEGLASALEKLKAHGTATKRPNTATAHLFFANPLSKKEFSSLFSTHPPIDERIKRLREMDSHA